MREVTRRGDHAVRREVRPVVQLLQIIGRQGADRIARAQDPVAVGMLGPQGLVAEIVHLIVRRILDGVDLLEHHVALELQVIAAKHRVAHQVCEHVERARQAGVVREMHTAAPPPRDYSASAISCALRRSVPLNPMCSSRCDTPILGRGSWALALRTQIPTAAERTLGTRSDNTITPVGAVVWKMSRSSRTVSISASAPVPPRACPSALYGRGACDRARPPRAASRARCPLSCPRPRCAPCARAAARRYGAVPPRRG